MKQQAIFVAVTVALLSSLIAAPAFADADHKYPQSPSTNSRATAQVTGAAVSEEYAEDGYGADAMSAAQSGTPSASKSFAVNGRSIYSNP
ncbi:hypothetical protein [Burkholderia metallica]|uniref:hypothetical protein n=1 Tax=Burkholderia metallica TaxID=488729 RepID=UPI001CF20F40|nr:hypothetical protein [Burkholderia metallica]MCA8023585.1 hypothetical protein [Burkholderia metallica]